MSSYPTQIRKRLSKVSDRAKLLFGLLTCEQLYPNYIAFQQQAGWGDAQALGGAIEAIYLHLTDDGKSSPAQIAALMDRIELVTPGINQFPGISAHFATDACIVTMSSLDYMMTNDIENIVAVATYAKDTVKTFTEAQGFLNSLSSASVTKRTDLLTTTREIRRQLRLIQELSKSGNQKITKRMIEALRNS